MLSDVSQDAGEGPDAEVRVKGNRDVMLATLHSGEPNMATCLTRYPVAQVSEGLGEMAPGDVPRQPHAVMTSSRTK